MLKQPRTPLRSAHSSSDLHWRGSHWIRLRRKQRQRRVQSLFQNSCLGWKRGAVCMQPRLWSELGPPEPRPPGPFPGGAGLSVMGLEFATRSSREAGSIQTLHPLHVTQMPMCSLVFIGFSQEFGNLCGWTVELITANQPERAAVRGTK